jgi:hypothetical protein
MTAKPIPVHVTTLTQPRRANPTGWLTCARDEPGEEYHLRNNATMDKIARGLGFRLKRHGSTSWYLVRDAHRLREPEEVAAFAATRFGRAPVLTEKDQELCDLVLGGCGPPLPAHEVAKQAGDYDLVLGGCGPPLPAHEVAKQAGELVEAGASANRALLLHKLVAEAGSPWTRRNGVTLETACYLIPPLLVFVAGT